MKILFGLFSASGGAILGCIAGVVAAIVILEVTKASNREGAHGYAMFALGFVGAAVGLVAGLLSYARSAPAGSGGTYLGAGLLGVAAVVAVLGLVLWAHVYFQERPVTYEANNQANLFLELRIETAKLPTLDRVARWFDVEVQTLTSQPTGYVVRDQIRTEGAHTIFPVIQSPLYRAGSRVIVVRIENQQVESFRPPMKRVPDARADWSEWYRPEVVDPPYGVVPAGPLQAMFELRYKVRQFGDD